MNIWRSHATFRPSAMWGADLRQGASPPNGCSTFGGLAFRIAKVCNFLSNPFQGCWIVFLIPQGALTRPWAVLSDLSGSIARWLVCMNSRPQINTDETRTGINVSSVLIRGSVYLLTALFATRKLEMFVKKIRKAGRREKRGTDF